MALTLEEINAIDLVRDHVGEAFQWGADALRENVSGHLVWRAEHAKYDSPLEVIFDLWWAVMQTLYGIAGDVDLVPQHEVTLHGRTYRVDFVLQPSYEQQLRLDALGVSWPRLCVELDGHDYHERTKEQVTYRNQRDRDLQTAGWVVLHYSGSELVRDPRACVQDANHKASNAFWLAEREATAREAEVR